MYTFVYDSNKINKLTHSKSVARLVATIDIFYEK